MNEGDIGRKSFINHVFLFDSHTKEELSNIIQYSILGLLPILFLNKLIQRFIPEANDEKSSIELLGEIIFQITVMFVGIFYIHRIITFIPTYSGIDYVEFSAVNIILAVLIIVSSLQTKLGEKINILFERVMDKINGKEGMEDKKDSKKQVIGATPISSIPSNPTLVGQSMNPQQLALQENFDLPSANQFSSSPFSSF
uniref:Uncharacterized protein n=1 Tax=viral metagenome TaxID=1070528 RepID=A0A6C0H6E6_9ZZZZ